MRVLLVSDFAPPVRGGLEVHVDTLATQLHVLGHEVHLATITSNAVLTSPDVTVHAVPSLARALPHESASRPFHPPIPEPLARRTLRKIIDSVRPDVVHAHSWLGISLPRRRPPLVYTAHDYGLICQLRTLLRDGALCAGPALAKCFTCASAATNPVAAAIMTPATVAGRRLFAPDALLAVSSAVRDALTPYLSAPIEVVPNFVGPEPEFKALPPGLPESGFALYAGDPGTHKGVGDLLDIWRGPQPPELPLVIASTKAIDVAGAPNIFLTSLDRAQMATAWRAATVALVPSRWADPCPTVVLEALRAGTPVIGTTVGGTPDLIRDRVDGLLVNPGDRIALRAMIDRLVDDAALARRLGESAAERSVEFDAKHVVDRIVQVYERVVAARRMDRE